MKSQVLIVDDYACNRLLTSHLRAPPSSHITPIILVTADATERRYITQACEAGAAGCVASAT